MAELILENTLAVLWILLFFKARKEQALQLTHFILFLFSIGILTHSIAGVFL